MGRRLRAVAPGGDRGVVSGWTGGMALVDLQSGDRLASLGFLKFGAGSGPWPELLSTGQVVAAAVTLARAPYLLVGAPESTGMVQVDLPAARSSSEKLYMDRLAVSEDGAVAAVVRSDMHVDLVDLRRFTLQGSISEPSETIQSLALSAGLDLLVLGLYGRLKVFRLSDLQRIGTLAPRALDGDVAWVGFSRTRLAAISVMGGCLVFDVPRGLAPAGWTRVARLEVDASSTVADIVGDMPRGSRRVVASLSDDGVLLAMRRGKKKVEVHPVAEGTAVALDGHTDRVNLVQFVAGGKVLVTADQDNRVGFWPRSIIRAPEKDAP